MARKQPPRIVLQSIKTSNQILVEGNNPKRFFQALAKHLNLADTQVQNFGGVNELRSRLQAFTNMPGFDSVERIAIIRDAEENAESAFQSVSDALKHCQLPCPTSHSEISDSGPPIVGIFILPGGVKSGAIEDLCLQSVNSNPAMTCVDNFIDCVESLTRASGVSSWNSADRSKAKLAAFLAAQERPDLRIGEAADKGIWPWVDSSFEPLRSFLLRLFPATDRS